MACESISERESKSFEEELNTKVKLQFDFLLKLQEKLWNGFKWFDAMDSLGKSSFILGSRLSEEDLYSLLHLVKDYMSTSGRHKY